MNVYILYLNNVSYCSRICGFLDFVTIRFFNYTYILMIFWFEYRDFFCVLKIIFFVVMRFKLGCENNLMLALGSPPPIKIRPWIGCRLARFFEMCALFRVVRKRYDTFQVTIRDIVWNNIVGETKRLAVCQIHCVNIRFLFSTAVISSPSSIYFFFFFFYRPNPFPVQ